MKLFRIGLTINHSDPPWIASCIKRHIRKRKRAYSKAKKTGYDIDWIKFRKLRNNVVSLIRNSKRSFYDKIAEKLRSENLSNESWWSTLKTFISPNFKSSVHSLQFNAVIYSDNQDKANILNRYFQSQTILDDKDAILPILPSSVLVSQLHGIILTPLEVESILKTLPIGKASGRELRYVLSTPLCSLFNEALDAGKEVRAVFCDISKAFDRVWHTGLLAKLRAAGVTGEALAWFSNYLSNRKQRVILPSAVSDWAYIKAGVPQGSILGLLLFLIYISMILFMTLDLLSVYLRTILVFFIIVDNPLTAARNLNTDLEKISRWAATWLVSFNPTKTESLLLSRKLSSDQHPPISMQNHQISEVSTHKHLGLLFSNDCTWHNHINYIQDKAWFRVNIMRKLKFKLDRKSLGIIYTAFIRP